MEEHLHSVEHRLDASFLAFSTQILQSDRETCDAVLAIARRESAQLEESLRGVVAALEETLRSETGALDKALLHEIVVLAETMHGEMEVLGKSLRSEMAALGKSLRGEMATVAETLRGEIAAKHSKLREEFAATGPRLRADTTALGNAFRADMVALERRHPCRHGRVEERLHGRHGCVGGEAARRDVHPARHRPASRRSSRGRHRGDPSVHARAARGGAEPGCAASPLESRFHTIPGRGIPARGVAHRSNSPCYSRVSRLAIRAPRSSRRCSRQRDELIAKATRR